MSNGLLEFLHLSRFFIRKTESNEPSDSTECNALFRFDDLSLALPGDILTALECRHTPVLGTTSSDDVLLDVNVKTKEEDHQFSILFPDENRPLLLGEQNEL